MQKSGKSSFAWDDFGAYFFLEWGSVIGGLLILFGFAAFSDGKLDYGIMAAVTVLFSILQSKIFVSGSVMSPAIQWGFWQRIRACRCDMVSDTDLADFLWWTSDSLHSGWKLGAHHAF